MAGNKDNSPYPLRKPTVLFMITACWHPVYRGYVNVPKSLDSRVEISSLDAEDQTPVYRGNRTLLSTMNNGRG